MIDIVDRLRVWSKGMEQQGAVVLSTAITEAADTIERLTAERDEAREEVLLLLGERLSRSEVTQEMKDRGWEYLKEDGK